MQLFKRNNTDFRTDKNISIVEGWNLIGYSSDVNLSIDNVKFTNSSGSEFTWGETISNNKMQTYLAYYDSSSATASERKYKYVATSGVDDTALRVHKGYWLKSNEAGNLTLPGIGGSYSNETYNVANLMFSNGSETKSFADAKTALWIANPQYWGRDDPEDDMEFMTLGSGNMNSWQGYFVYSYYNNITLMRQN